ncbi:MAG: Hpt domain-containing protein [Eubacteriales bacterium]|nr:Hpt domain-containing protein [Eubacteriales bacterium]
MEHKYVAELSKAGIDYLEGLHRFADNQGLYLKYMKRFCTDDELDQLMKSLSAARYEEKVRIVHSIKGLAASLSLNGLRDACVQLERSLAERRDCNREMEQCKEAYRKAVRVISEMPPP